MLSTYSPFLSISVKLVSFDFRCFIIIAWRINDEQVAPKRTTLKRYVTSGLKGSVGSSNQKNLVTSLSLLCNFICRKAFSISVVTAYGFNLNLVKKSFMAGGTDFRQSFRLALPDNWWQLQSNLTWYKHNIFCLILADLFSGVSFSVHSDG